MCINRVDRGHLWAMEKAASRGVTHRQATKERTSISFSSRGCLRVICLDNNKDKRRLHKKSLASPTTTPPQLSCQKHLVQSVSGKNGRTLPNSCRILINRDQMWCLKRREHPMDYRRVTHLSSRRIITFHKSRCQRRTLSRPTSPPHRHFRRPSRSIGRNHPPW